MDFSTQKIPHYKIHNIVYAKFLMIPQYIGAVGR